MRIAVVGAGIGGLTLAAALSGDGHEVTVFERRENPGAVGAGLTLFRNAFAALDEVGLGDPVRDVSSDAISHMKAGQRTPSGDWLMAMPAGVTPPIRSLHRADLHRALVAALPARCLRLGERAVVSHTGDGTLVVADRTERYELVVAADGLRSESRARLGLDRGVRYAGYTAWRGITDRAVDVLDEAGETWGRGRIFGIVPLPDDRVYWFATSSTAPGGKSEGEQQAVHDLFGDWHAPILECVDATPSDEVLRHDVFDLARLPASFVTGRTVLLGDAAHGMTPNLGQGAGQAIEDAVTLTLLLRAPDIDPLKVLAHYNRLRRARTKVIWLQSRLMGRVAQLSNPVGAGLRNALLWATPPAVLIRRMRALQRWTAP